MNAYDKLAETVNTHKTHHIPFDWLPNLACLSIIHFGFDNVPMAFRIERSGMWFFTYRLQDYIDKDLEAYLWELWQKRPRTGDELATEINILRNYQISAGDPRTEYILTLVDDSLYSILTDYKPLYNETIIHWIKKRGLTNKVRYFEYDPEKLEIFLEITTIDNLSFGMRIVNGETGRVAFSYTAYIRNENGYVFDWPLHAKRRHLSLIDRAIGGLTAALDDMALLNVHDGLRRTKVGDVPNLTKIKNFEKIRDRISPSMSVLEMMAELSEVENKYGYKMVCKAVYDAALDVVRRRI